MSFTKLSMVLLSPVHIGTGEELSPDEYFIRGETLHVVRSSAFVRLPKNEQDRLLQRISAKNFHPMEISRAYARYADQLEEDLVSRHPAGIALVEKWQDNRSANQLQLNRMVHLPHTGHGYIPGSTLKGVFRTALLDIVKKIKVQKGDSGLNDFLRSLQGKRGRLTKESRMLEQLLLDYDQPDQDPLKYLKISDSSLFAHTGHFQKLTNHNRESGKEGVYVWAETASPGERISFTWQSGFSTHQTDSLKIFGDISIWMQALNMFYCPLIKEQQQFAGISPQWSRLVSQIAQTLDKEKGALICIGKHTGAETKTLNDIRRIQVGRGRAASIKKSGNTFWMDEHNLPLGWAYITCDQTDPLLEQVPETISSWEIDNEHTK